MLQTLAKDKLDETQRLLRGYETAMAKAIISRNSESITEVLDCLRARMEDVKAARQWIERETLDRYCAVLNAKLEAIHCIGVSALYALTE